MTTTVHSSILEGLRAVPVTIQAAQKGGLGPALSINRADFKGTAQDDAEFFRETRIMVQSALAHSGIGTHLLSTVEVRVRAEGDLPLRRGHLSGLDLPIALAVLAHVRGVVFSPPPFARGLLNLRGLVLSARGDFRAAELAQMRGRAALLSAGHGSHMPSFVPVGGLEQALAAAQGKGGTMRLDDSETRRPYNSPEQPDLADMALPLTALRPLLGAMVAGLGSTLYGRPGSGTMMLARRLGGLLPEITGGELRTVRRLYNDAGMPPPNDRPFRAPHHTASIAALTGGTAPGLAIERPGEMHLATHGVLFLDELLEFGLQVLRAFSTDRPKHTFLPVAVVRPGEHAGSYQRVEPFRSQLFPVVVTMPEPKFEFEGPRTSTAAAREIIEVAKARPAPPLDEAVLGGLPQGGNTRAERAVLLATALARLDGAERTTQIHIDEALTYLEAPTGKEIAA
jgi:magnesium chelatase family protein